MPKVPGFAAFDPVDVHVGKLIRARRRARGMSQQELAKAIGVSFQQVQKYERGANRVSASKLFSVAKALDLRVASFFDGLEETGPGGSALTEFDEFLVLKGSSELVKAYQCMSTDQRRVVVGLARIIVAP